jgi:MarR family transcriptional regulator for hemolysin
MPVSLSEQCVREVLDGVPPVIWFMRRQMRQHRGQLSLPQFRVLVRLSREPAASLSAVAEHLGVSLPTVSRLIGTMVGRGLLARARGADGDERRIALTITPRGQAVLDLARGETQRQMHQKLAALSSEQQAMVIEAMGLLKGVFGGFSDPTAQALPDGVGYAAQPTAAE